MSGNNMQGGGGASISYETFDYSKCTHLFKIHEETEELILMKCSICNKEKIINLN